MARLLIYEYCTALGLGREPSDPAHSLYREGQAMRSAVMAAFANVPGIMLDPINDLTEANEEAELKEQAQGCELAIVIAPEFQSLLLTRTRWLRESGCQVLGSTDDALRFTSDKFALARHWHHQGIPTPTTDLADVAPRFPCVVKPREGAGSTATRLVHRPEEYAEAIAAVRESPAGEPLVQEYTPGMPVSVSFLVGPGIIQPLLPGRQRLSSDGHFHYQGGEFPLRGEEAERAVRLARRAIEVVPGLHGYVGVDLILGPDPSGRDDRAIEINPRFTTSIVGLVALARGSLGQALLRVTAGQPVELDWTPGTLSFGPDGSLVEPG